MLRESVLSIVVCASTLAPAQLARDATSLEPMSSTPQARTAAPERQRDRADAALRGRVVDDLGDGVPGAWVAAHASTLHQPRSTLTDATGSFELTSLGAGRYLIVVSKPGYANPEMAAGLPSPGRQVTLAPGESVDRLAIVLRRGALIAGRVVDEHGAPAAGITVSAVRSLMRHGHRRLVASERTATTDDRGEYRLWGLEPGSYMVSAESAPPLGPFSATPGSGYAPTFAPGTALASEAARFDVVAGQEIAAEIRLTRDRLVRVGGTVSSASGPVVGGWVRLLSRGEVRRDGPSGPILDDGRFSLPAVPPGEYLIVARSGPARFPAPAAQGAPAVAEVGVQPLDVGREDLTEVRVITSPGVALTGLVTAEPGPMPPAARVKVQVVPGDPDVVPSGAPLLAIDATGVFAGPPMVGPVRVQPLLPRGWMLTSATYDGSDVIERPFELRAQGGPVRLVITNRLTVVTGTVIDAAGKPSSDCEVLVFAHDRARWASGARSVRRIRPDQNGVYRVEALAPGDYHVVAFTTLPPDAASDPAMLDRLIAVAETVRLETGSEARRDLTVTVIR